MVNHENVLSVLQDCLTTDEYKCNHDNNSCCLIKTKHDFHLAIIRYLEWEIVKGHPDFVFCRYSSGGVRGNYSLYHQNVHSDKY